MARATPRPTGSARTADPKDSAFLRRVARPRPMVDPDHQEKDRSYEWVFSMAQTTRSVWGGVTPRRPNLEAIWPRW